MVDKTEFEKLKNLATDAISQGLIIHDKGKVLYANKSFEDITGYDLNYILNCENLVEELATPDSKSIIKRNINTGNETPYNIQIIDSEGKVKDILIESKNTIYQEKKLRVTLYTDLTNIYDNLDETVNSLELDETYKTILSNLNEAYCITNIKNKITYTNNAFEKLLGLSPKLIINNPINSIFKPTEYEKIEEIKSNKTDANHSLFNLKITNNYNLDKYVKLSLAKIYDKNKNHTGWIYFFLDVSTQVMINDALKDRYKYEKYLFNLSQNLLNFDNFPEKISQAIDELKKLSNTKSISIEFNKHPYSNCSLGNCELAEKSFSNQTHEKIADTLFQNNELKNRDYLDIDTNKEKQTNTKDIIGIAKKEGLNNLLCFQIYLGNDICGILMVSNYHLSKTDHNHFLFIRNYCEIFCDSIQRKINHDQITRLNEQMIEKNKEIEQVLYVTSHDIRSPLVNIIGFTKELNKAVDELKEYVNQNEISEEDKSNINFIINDDVPEIISFINSGGIKIDKLLKSLLQLSRLGRTPIEYEKIDGTLIINEIVASMRYQLEEYKIKFSTEKLPVFNCDKNLFTQIFTNLIDNAIKYHDNSKDDRYINVSSIHEDDYYIVKVSDNGLGIPDEKKEKVFEVFSRLDPDKTQGEGIGLNIIKKAIERLNGKIELESEYGKGTTFTVQFLTK